MAGDSKSRATVPYGADQTIYLVVDSHGSTESACREAEFERADLESAIGDLLAGRFNNPLRVIAYNTLEHWTEDLSPQVAVEIQSRCDIDGQAVPEHLKDFVEAHGGLPWQQALRFA